MLVKDVVLLASENLGREDLSAQITALSGSPEGEIASLVRCYNLVENEVALDYFPLKAEETLSVSDGKVAYSAFAHAPVDVLRVTDGDRELPFEVLSDSLRLKDSATRVCVTYAYAPAEKKIGDECAFSGRVSARLLSFGVTCEFLLTSARYQEAATWEKRYREALRAAGVLRRRLCIRSRRWV